jgi:hypothetical protein
MMPPIKLLIVLSQYSPSHLFADVVVSKNVGMKVWYAVVVVPLTDALDARFTRGINM